MGSYEVLTLAESKIAPLSTRDAVMRENCDGRIPPSHTEGGRSKEEGCGLPFMDTFTVDVFFLVSVTR